MMSILLRYYDGLNRNENFAERSISVRSFCFLSFRTQVPFLVGSLAPMEEIWKARSRCDGISLTLSLTHSAPHDRNFPDK